MYNIYKVPGVRVEVKYRPSLHRSIEEKNIRTLSLGIQNDDEVIIKLTFTVFADIIVNVSYFKTIGHIKII